MSAYFASIPRWPIDAVACAACDQPVTGSVPCSGPASPQTFHYGPHPDCPECGQDAPDDYALCPTCEAALSDPVAVLRRAYAAEDAESLAAEQASRMRRERDALVLREVGR